MQFVEDASLYAAFKEDSLCEKVQACRDKSLSTVSMTKQPVMGSVLWTWCS